MYTFVKSRCPEVVHRDAKKRLFTQEPGHKGGSAFHGPLRRGGRNQRERLRGERGIEEAVGCGFKSREQELFW